MLKPPLDYEAAIEWECWSSISNRFINGLKFGSGYVVLVQTAAKAVHKKNKEISRTQVPTVYVSTLVIPQRTFRMVVVWFDGVLAK